MSELSLKTLYGAAIRPFLPEVARLRIEVFREWPYLYDGDLDYEARYLEVYAQSASAVLVLVRDGERIVGASTGIPLAEESEPFRKPFIEAGIPPEAVFYCGESVLEPAYRGRGLYRHFFAQREAHARALGGFRWCAFAAVERDPHDPRRPKTYRPLDTAWEKAGYRKAPHLRMQLGWKELGQDGERLNTLVFWLRAL